MCVGGGGGTLRGEGRGLSSMLSIWVICLFGRTRPQRYFFFLPCRLVFSTPERFIRGSRALFMFDFGFDNVLMGNILIAFRSFAQKMSHLLKNIFGRKKNGSLIRSQLSWLPYHSRDTPWSP